MEIETIAGVQYEVSSCGRCGGTGRRYDATAADKVNAGPFAGRCATCNGKGKTYRSLVSVERDRQDREQLQARLAEQQIGEIPDWMC